MDIHLSQIKMSANQLQNANAMKSTTNRLINATNVLIDIFPETLDFFKMESVIQFQKVATIWVCLTKEGRNVIDANHAKNGKS